MTTKHRSYRVGFPAHHNEQNPFRQPETAFNERSEVKIKPVSLRDLNEVQIVAIQQKIKDFLPTP
ncbi:MAG: hypothetical protein IKH45_01840 [Neisseriaceae bacterium]|nr:hypothetical protein [Neisseriaceae bacterium]